MVGAPEPRLAARQLGAAKRALAKSQGKGSSGSGTIGAIDKATAVSMAAALESDIIHVDDDLPAAPLDSKVLSAWLQAVACGKTVAVKHNKTHIGSKAAVKRPASVRLTDALAAKHKSLAIQLRRILKLPSSKWREVSTGGDPIGDLSGMRSFLVKMHRRPLICGVGGATGDAIGRSRAGVAVRSSRCGLGRCGGHIQIGLASGRGVCVSRWCSLLLFFCDDPSGGRRVTIC